MPRIEKVTFGAVYGETILVPSETEEGQFIHHHFQGSASYDVVPESKDEEEEWLTSEKIDAMRAWISQTLFDSIQKEKKERGIHSLVEEE